MLLLTCHILTFYCSPHYGGRLGNSASTASCSSQLLLFVKAEAPETNCRFRHPPREVEGGQRPGETTDCMEVPNGL